VPVTSVLKADRCAISASNVRLGVLRGLVVVAFLACSQAAIARADEPAPDATPVPADCTVVGIHDVATILGFAVQPPDPASQSGGICFFTSRDISHDGNLSYAVVTADRLPQRRAFFRAFSRRCAPAVKGTLNELMCRQYLKLAVAETMDDYFAARTGAGDASPVPGIGDSAVASGNALYVRRAQTVFEISVTRAGDFDLPAATAVANELLARVRS
jgi:hypothetical protein